jgi:hypothetical protein
LWFPQPAKSVLITRKWSLLLTKCTKVITKVQRWLVNQTSEITVFVCLHWSTSQFYVEILQPTNTKDSQDSTLQFYLAILQPTNTKDSQDVVHLFTVHHVMLQGATKFNEVFAQIKFKQYHSKVRGYWINLVLCRITKTIMFSKIKVLGLIILPNKVNWSL